MLGNMLGIVSLSEVWIRRLKGIVSYFDVRILVNAVVVVPVVKFAGVYVIIVVDVHVVYRIAVVGIEVFVFVHDCRAYCVSLQS